MLSIICKLLALFQQNLCTHDDVNRLLILWQVWYEYARWHMDGGGGGHAAAAAVLAKAVTALPG